MLSTNASQVLTAASSILRLVSAFLGWFLWLVTMPARNASSEASGIWNSNAELQPTVIRPCSNTVAHSPSYSPAASSTNHCPAAGSAIDQHTQAWYRCCLQQLRKPLMTTCLGVRHKRLINNRLQAALNLFLFYSWQSSCPATSSRAKFAKHTEILQTRVVEGSAPATMATQCSRQVASSNPMLQVSWQYASWVEKVVPGYGLGCVILTINLHHSSKHGNSRIIQQAVCMTAAS